MTQATSDIFQVNLLEAVCFFVCLCSMKIQVEIMFIIVIIYDHRKHFDML